MIFEKYEVADVSTGYLEESDLPLLLQIHCPQQFCKIDGGFGTFHRVSDDDQLFEEDLKTRPASASAGGSYPSFAICGLRRSRTSALTLMEARFKAWKRLTPLPSGSQQQKTT